MTQPSQEWKPSRAAGNTVVVIMVIVGLFCVLPAVICGGIIALGTLTH